MNPKIIFDDASLIVIDKPAGMVVNNAKTVVGETVQDWLEKNYKILDTRYKDTEFWQKGGVVHRLDKETSGLLVLAKNPESYEKLKTQFLERKVNKMYVALVHGFMMPEKGIISIPIVRHPKDWGKFTTGDDLSRTAITEWTRVKSFEISGQNKGKYSLVELKPMTGRTHQLRVHLKHLGFPIVSDPLYVGDKTLKLDLSWCPRMFLHAKQLELVHPVSGEIMTWKSDLPEILQKTLEKLVN